MYKVIREFRDMQDGMYLYKVGDAFPRLGKSVDSDRLKELSSSDNLAGFVLIVWEDDPVPVVEVPQVRVKKGRKNAGRSAESN